MVYTDTTAEQFPDKGFYYHYKHDPSAEVNNYAYEVVGVGHHTEEDCREEDRYMVVYRPLYEAFVYKNGKMFDLRPLDMWIGDVEKEGRTFPRFVRITDVEVISKLDSIRKGMYEE